MYLSEIKLWNFRKYGMSGDKIENAKPGLTVIFNKGLNLLIGENDSGKTAIIDEDHMEGQISYFPTSEIYGTWTAERLGN